MLPNLCADDLVEYDSVEEFVLLWTSARDAICSRLVEFINAAQLVDHNSRGTARLHWTVHDFLVLGLHDFSTPQLYSFFRTACKKPASEPEIAECMFMQAILQARLSACNGVYVASMRMHDVRFNTYELCVCLQGEVDRFLGHPQSIACDRRLAASDSLLALDRSELLANPVRSLFDANFIRVFFSDGTESFVLPKWRWRLHLVAVMMAAHERLGTLSPLFELDELLLRKICELL